LEEVINMEGKNAFSEIQARYKARQKQEEELKKEAEKREEVKAKLKSTLQSEAAGAIDTLDDTVAKADLKETLSDEQKRIIEEKQKEAQALKEKEEKAAARKEKWNKFTAKITSFGKRKKNESSKDGLDAGG